MPCTLTGSLEGDELLAYEHHAKTMAAMLCAALTQIETHKLPIPSLCAHWWERHKAIDAVRTTHATQRERQ